MTIHELALVIMLAPLVILPILLLALVVEVIRHNMTGGD